MAALAHCRRRDGVTVRSARVRGAAPTAELAECGDAYHLDYSIVVPPEIVLTPDGTTGSTPLLVTLTGVPGTGTTGTDPPTSDTNVTDPPETGPEPAKTDPDPPTPGPPTDTPPSSIDETTLPTTLLRYTTVTANTDDVDGATVSDGTTAGDAADKTVSLIAVTTDGIATAMVDLPGSEAKELVTATLEESDKLLVVVLDAAVTAANR